MRRRNRRRNDGQPRQHPARQPPQRGREQQRQKKFHAARPAINRAQLHPHQTMKRLRPGQDGKQQQPEIKHPQHQPEAENGKQQNAPKGIAAKREFNDAQIQFSRRPARLPNRFASKALRAAATARPAPPANAIAANAAARPAASVPISVAGVRLPSGSKRTERQFSHNNRPARFKMKSMRPM